MEERVIVGAARTPVGAYLGRLASLTAPKLGAIAIKAALARSGIAPADVSEVYMGLVLQAGVGMAPARQASLEAGLPRGVPCTTINKVCGSGLKTVMLAASQIGAGEADIIVAGGMESMSNAPFLLRNARAGLSLGDHPLEDTNMVDGLRDFWSNSHVGICADDTAADCKLTREDQDRFALRSYERALAAQRSGAFDDEIVPVEIATRQGTTTVTKDESPRETSFEALSKLPPAFSKDGTVTAGNASTINDGASAVVVASASRARALGVKPLARIVGQAQSGREPERFLLAPTEAIKALLDKLSWSVNDVDLWEVNEAFSGIEAVRRQVGIPEERLNVNGGAVALGHALGSSGGRLLVTLLYALRKRAVKRGVVAVCLGGGEAVALAVEAV